MLAPSAPSAADPFIISSAAEAHGSAPTVRRNADGRSRVHPSVILAGSNIGVLVSAGQSNGAGANYTSAAYTITQTHNYTLSLYDGAIYQTADPMLGGSGTVGSWGARLADKLLAAGIFDRVVMVPTDIGSTDLSSWMPSGNLHFHRLVAATKRATAAGLSVSAYLWGQGEAEAGAGTSQAAYQAGVTSIISTLRGYGAEFQAPWFIGVSTLQGNAVNSTIQAAQAALPNGTTIFAGGNTDTLTGATNRSDTTHFNATGANAAADLWKTALDAVF